MAVDSTLAARLDDQLTADLLPDGRLGLPRRYLLGDHALPYMPRGAKKEYELLAQRAVTNWTPLLSDTYSKGLFVDGIRGSGTSTNEAVWRFWQANGLDARQTIAHRGALEYGTSYAIVLPGEKDIPYFRPLSPLRSAAWYEDEDDEFPEIGFRRKGTATDGTELVELVDKTSVYTFAKPKDGQNWILQSADDHGLGVTPFVRFRDRLDGEARGIIRPIINLQDRVNEVVFSTLIALQYASFRQRWATGLAIPIDEETDEPVEPFQAAIDRLWVSEDESTKFGDFAQTELSGHLGMYDSTVRTLAAVSQVSPNILTGDLVNLSADALAQMEASTQRKISEYETIFGESWESGLRLAAIASGDSAITVSEGASVRWRDTEARALASTVDALGKMAQMLEIPVEGLWDKIPGITDQDVELWKSLRSMDPLAELTAEITRQAGAAPTKLDPDPVAPTDASAVPADAPAAGAARSEDASATKAKADALGVLIRSGVSAESAAAEVGLEGVEFTGAVPVSLRLPESDTAALEE